MTGEVLKLPTLWASWASCGVRVLLFLWDSAALFFYFCVSIACDFLADSLGIKETQQKEEEGEEEDEEDEKEGEEEEEGGEETSFKTCFEATNEVPPQSIRPSALGGRGR